MRVSYSMETVIKMLQSSSQLAVIKADTREHLDLIGHTWWESPNFHNQYFLKLTKTDSNFTHILPSIPAIRVDKRPKKRYSDQLCTYILHLSNSKQLSSTAIIYSYPNQTTTTPKLQCTTFHWTVSGGESGRGEWGWFPTLCVLYYTHDSLWL